MIEAAIALPVFFLIIFSAIDLSIVSYRAAGLHYTLNAATRWAELGQTIAGQSRVNSIKQKVREIGSAYGLTLNAANVHVCPVGSTNCSPESAGVADAYIQISATELMPIIFGMYRITLSYSVLGRNEPFTS